MNEIYENMTNGVYNIVVRTFAKNLDTSSEISLKLVEKDCKEKNLKIDDFLTYARNRKREED